MDTTEQPTRAGSARCAGCGRAPVGPAAVFCAPCTALIACTEPLPRPVRITPQYLAPGWMRNGIEEVTRVHA